MQIPAGLSWLSDGPATLCFSGRGTFVGSLKSTQLQVERMLPELPLVSDPNEIFDPTPAVREALDDRLSAELARRKQQKPVMPDVALWDAV